MALGLASLVCVVLVGARIAYTGRDDTANLVWNLTLAWIPLLLALVVYDGFRRGASKVSLLAGAGLWVLFFPNAPYILTDFKWLPEWSGVPLWFDVVVLVLASATGVFLGFASLYLMHALARRVLGPLRSWALVTAFLGLSSVGIYLGRFLHWNSWDVFTQPLSLISDVSEGLADPLSQGRVLALTALSTVFLTLSYAVFYRVTPLRLSDEPQDGR